MLKKMKAEVIISIHSLRGEGDFEKMKVSVKHESISIHSLRGEGDDISKHWCTTQKLFQSTPSVGRETNNPRHIKIC